MITIWTWTADLRKENRRLKETLQTVSQEVPLPREPTVIQVPTDDGRFADLAMILFDQAVLSEGGQIDDPAVFVHKINALLQQLMA